MQKLLHQKLAREQSSKSFYKQQWTNVVRDMEKLESQTTGITTEPADNEDPDVAPCDDNRYEVSHIKYE